MKAGLWLGLVLVSLSHTISTAEPDNPPPPPPAGSQYNYNLRDTTETAGDGGQLVSHRDIRVMFALSSHATGLTLILLSSQSFREFWASGEESSLWAFSSC